MHIRDTYHAITLLRAHIHEYPIFDTSEADIYSRRGLGCHWLESALASFFSAVPVVPLEGELL